MSAQIRMYTAKKRMYPAGFAEYALLGSTGLPEAYWELLFYMGPGRSRKVSGRVTGREKII